MAAPSELHENKPHSYSMLLKSFVTQPDQTQELEDFLARLEKEWFKIEAFKRELPLCMQLLNNGIALFLHGSLHVSEQTNKRTILEIQ